MKIRVIVNPKAGAGAARRKLPQIERALRNHGVAHETVETRAPGDATELSRRARNDGVEVLVVVGGDGTLNEVSQAYLDDGGAPLPGPALAIIPAGTGGDFRRTLGIDKDADLSVARFLASEPRSVDLGIVELTGDRGEPVRRAFVNIASFGVSGRIDRLVNESPKWIGGRAAFALGSLRAMSTYRNAPVTIRVDGTPWYEGRVVVGAIANGRFFGGGMQVAPEADPTDGRFDVVVLGDLTFAESLRVGPKLYAGKHLGSPRVLSTRGTIVEAAPLDDRPVYVDADGETPGRLPLRATIAPGALRFLA
jgi:YegS/Rv2252/BmrU family lipid kinase